MVEDNVAIIQVDAPGVQKEDVTVEVNRAKNKVHCQS